MIYLLVLVKTSYGMQLETENYRYNNYHDVMFPTPCSLHLGSAHLWVWVCRLDRKAYVKRPSCRHTILNKVESKNLSLMSLIKETVKDSITMMN